MKAEHITCRIRFQIVKQEKQLFFMMVENALRATAWQFLYLFILEAFFLNLRISRGKDRGERIELISAHSDQCPNGAVNL